MILAGVAMADVFISYKREERDRCVAIHDRLTALKFSVWFDARLELTVPFRREIAQELAAAKAVLVLWSNASSDSDFVQDEASRGQQAGKLISVRIEACDIPLGFGARHGGDLIETTFDRRDENWMKVLRRLGDLTGRPGVAEFVQLGDDATPQQWASWRERFSDDPLCDAMRSPREQELERRVAALLAEKTALEDERTRLQALVDARPSGGAPSPPARPGFDTAWLAWPLVVVLAIVLFTSMLGQTKAEYPDATAPAAEAAAPAAADAAAAAAADAAAPAAADAAAPAADAAAPAAADAMMAAEKK
jgi:hypothetical protein